MEDIVSLYSESQTERNHKTDTVGDCTNAEHLEPRAVGGDDDETSSSKKRRRRCLSEQDVNSCSVTTAAAADGPDDDDDAVVENEGISTCRPDDASTAGCTPAVGLTRSNKENCFVATPVSDTTKTPRRNVFAQGRDVGAARERFNLNATKDQLMSPEPPVEVRSR